MARELSNEYGVGYSMIHKWIRANTPHLITKVTPEQSNAELTRIKELEEEVEILKKRWGYSRGNKLPLSIHPRSTQC